MASIEIPAWLPDGWLMMLKAGKDGRYDRYYTSPLSGRTFRSRTEVLQYLNTESIDDLTPQSPASHEHGDQQILVQQDLPLWLPNGWILETRTRKSGKKAGTKYKYYTDPVSGYIFRSKLDVVRYLETGEISRHAFRPKRKRTEAMCSVKESPPPIKAKVLKQVGTAARRCLFVQPIPSCNGVVADETDEVPGEELSSQDSDTELCGVGSSLSMAPVTGNVEATEIQVETCKDQTSHAFFGDQISERKLEFPKEYIPIESSQELLVSHDKLLKPFTWELLEVGVEKIVKLENNNLPDIGRDLSSKESVSKYTSKITKASTRRPRIKVAARSLRNNAVDGIISGDKTQPDSLNVTKIELLKEDLASADSQEPLILKLSESGEPSCQLTRNKVSERANETLTRKTFKYLMDDHHVSTKAKNKETFFLPRRSSKRLAGVDPGPAVAIELSDRSLRKRVRCAVSSRRNLSKQESNNVDHIDIMLLPHPRHPRGQIEKITREDPGSDKHNETAAASVRNLSKQEEPNDVGQMKTSKCTQNIDIVQSPQPSCLSEIIKSLTRGDTGSDDHAENAATSRSNLSKQEQNSVGQMTNKCNEYNKIGQLAQPPCASGKIENVTREDTGSDKHIKIVATSRSNLLKRDINNVGQMTSKGTHNGEIMQLPQPSSPSRQIENISGDYGSVMLIETAEAGDDKHKPRSAVPFDSWPDRALSWFSKPSPVIFQSPF